MLFDGLSPIVCGVLGYVSIILYDLNNTSHNNDRMQSLHTVGAGLIGLAFSAPSCPAFRRPIPCPQRYASSPVYWRSAFALLIYLTLIAGGRTNWKRKDPQKRWWGKGSRDDGSLRSLPPSECLGDALFSVCCSFRRRTLIRGAPPLSACAVCCWQCMRTSMFSRCSCAGTTPTRTPRRSSSPHEGEHPAVL